MDIKEKLARIRKACDWESLSEEDIQALGEGADLIAVQTLIQTMESYKDDDIEDDAGDVGRAGIRAGRGQVGTWLASASAPPLAALAASSTTVGRNRLPASSKKWWTTRASTGWSLPTSSCSDSAPKCRLATHATVWMSRRPPGPSLTLGSSL